ncbi:MAG: hypothetical protein LBC59_03590 [Chitinispirillales bacterium]|jgi:hypothetical protein|nr:hypothetical protein [Chitinispirillales bacterium]
MITTEMEAKPVVDDVDDLDGVPGNDPDSEYEYPPELLKFWVERGRIMDEKIARGELKPVSIRDVAAEYGVILD